MDAKDAQRINEEIEKLSSNQVNMKTDINKQIAINNQMIDRFENITNHINKQQEAIGKYLKYYKEIINNRIKTGDDIIRHSQYLTQINYNIDMLNNHLTNLAEAIVLARLNIISKQILNPKELAEIYYNLKNQSVSIKSNENIYELLGLQAYYNNLNIIFNVRIPVLSQDSYSMFHLVPLPINHTKTIVTKPYVILNSKTIQYFDEECFKIEDTYYCKESPQQETTNTSKCIGPLIQNQPAECYLKEQINIQNIQQPERNYILLTDAPETFVKTSCDSTNLKLKGTKLIHFENCSVEINGIIYQENINSYWDDIHIYPTAFNKVNYSYTIEDLQLQKIKTFHIKNKKAIELLEIKTVQRDYLTHCIVTILGFITLVISISIIHGKIKAHRNKLPIICQNISTAENPGDPPRTQLFWPTLHS